MSAPFQRPGAVCVDRFTVNARIALPPEVLPGKPDRCAIRTVVELRRDVEGRHHALINMATSTFTGDDGTIDSISIDAMTTLVRIATVKELKRRRLPSGTQPVTIWIPKTMERVGEGRRTMISVGRGGWRE